MAGGDLSEHRILIVSHAAEIGGAERVLFGLVDKLDRERFKIALAVPTESSLTEEMAVRGVPLHTGIPRPRLLDIRRENLGRDRLAILLYPWDMLRTVHDLARLIRRDNYDLIYTNSAKAHIYGTLAARAARRPVVWRMHDIVDTDAYSRLNVRLFLLAAGIADRVLAVSDAGRDALASWGVPPGKLATIHNGIDLASMHASRDRDEMRRELGIPAGAPVAGMVGRIVPWKGPQVFIEAARRVLEAVPDAYFLLVGGAVFGEAAFVDELKARVAQMGIEDRVVFTGLRQDIPELVSAMDILVHASILPEPFGMVLLEAMACRLPVVATEGGGVGEIVVAGETGVLVPPGEPEAMARAIVNILQDRKAARSMGEAGYERVASEFDAGRVARAIEYEWAKQIEAREAACG